MSAKDPRSPSGKPSGGWRRGPQSAPRGGRLPGQKQGGWTQRKDRDYDRAARRHRIRIAAWSLLLVALIVGFCIKVFWWPVKTPFLVATATNYRAPIPPNAWAREDAARLETLDAVRKLQYTDVPWDDKESGRQELRELYSAATPGGPDKNLVIVYLSAHGVVDENNRPCLIPPGASPLNSDEWLPISTLLEDLVPKSRRNRPSDATKTLLILDANRMEANWSLGLLYNGFAKRLEEVVKEEKVAEAGLVVLNSTRPGQIGWAAPELRNSAFGFFLEQGLRGEADVEQPEGGDGDGEVSLQELYRYLRRHLSNWVSEHRAAELARGQQ